MAKDLWEYNHIQFPRLLSEIMACVDISEKNWTELEESMDLSRDEILELFNRAQEDWESIKNMHCPPIKA